MENLRLFVVNEGLVSALSLHGAVSQASGANVLFGHRTLLIHDGNLLDIRVPMGGGFAITVADGITAHLAFSANAANSRHISIPPVTISLVIGEKDLPSIHDLITISRKKTLGNSFYGFLKISCK